MAIMLPDYVYRNLIKFRNCALPNKCLEMNKQSLERHLSKKVGFEIKIRKAYYETEMTDYTRGRKTKGKKPCLIAEEI